MKLDYRSVGTNEVRLPISRYEVRYEADYQSVGTEIIYEAESNIGATTV